MSIYDDARQDVEIHESWEVKPVAVKYAQALIDLVEAGEQGHSIECRRDLARQGPLRLDSYVCVLCDIIERIRVREEMT